MNPEPCNCHECTLARWYTSMHGQMGLKPSDLPKYPPPPPPGPGQPPVSGPGGGSPPVTAAEPTLAELNAEADAEQERLGFKPRESLKQKLEHDLDEFGEAIGNAVENRDDNG